jgi:hypothetical protein
MEIQSWWMPRIAVSVKTDTVNYLTPALMLLSKLPGLIYCPMTTEEKIESKHADMESSGGK